MLAHFVSLPTHCCAEAGACLHKNAFLVLLVVGGKCWGPPGMGTLALYSNACDPRDLRCDGSSL